MSLIINFRCYECCVVFEMVVVRSLTKSILAEIVSALRNGSVIAVPTDTIYGVACLAQSTYGVKKIYSIKSRDVLKPIAILVSSVSQVSQYAEVSELISMVLQRLLPGPVTAVLPRKETLNPELNPGVESIGIRVIESDLLTPLVNALDEPLALTSANVSGEPSSLCVEDFASIHKDLDFILDAGTIATPRDGSTVVDFSQEGRYSIIREGQEFHKTVTTIEEFGLVRLN